MHQLVFLLGLMLQREKSEKKFIAKINILFARKLASLLPVGLWGIKRYTYNPMGTANNSIVIFSWNNMEQYYDY